MNDKRIPGAYFMRENRGVEIVLVVFFVAAAVVTGVVKYYFRVETVDNPALGEMKYRYMWGERAWLEVDRDRDGRPEAKAKLLPGSPATPEEMWEDRNSDGVFEIHARMDKRGAIIFLEIDDDNDGVMDVVLHDKEAADYWVERFVNGENPK